MLLHTATIQDKALHGYGLLAIEALADGRPHFPVRPKLHVPGWTTLCFFFSWSLVAQPQTFYLGGIAKASIG